MASLSPVIIDSSTSKLSTFTILASTTKLSPCFKYSKSSNKISSGKISFFFPSLITLTLILVTIFNLSMIILALIS